jgi:hypothetical protein
MGLLSPVSRKTERSGHRKRVPVTARKQSHDSAAMIEEDNDSGRRRLNPAAIETESISRFLSARTMKTLRSRSSWWSAKRSLGSKLISPKRLGAKRTSSLGSG